MESLPAMVQNFVGLIERLQASNPEKSFKIKTPFFSYAGTVGGFLEQRSAFRLALKEYYRITHPEFDYTRTKEDGGKEIPRIGA